MLKNNSPELTYVKCVGIISIAQNKKGDLMSKKAALELSLIHGVGINDMMNSTSSPHYTKWYNMLSRCYRKSESEKKNTYSGDSVADEWHFLSNFHEWLLSINGYTSGEDSYTNGKCIDKNLIIPASSIYSKETCVFVSPRINKVTFIRERDDEFPIGIRKESNGHFSVRFCNKYVATKPTALEAHMVWLGERIKYMSSLAKDEMQKDRVGAMLLERHVKLMTIHRENNVEFKKDSFLLIDNDNINEILGFFYKK